MTDLTPAEENTLAWQTLPCRYATCVQPAGRRCITSSGERTTPHAARISDIRIWLARQPEVDELQRALDVSNGTVTSLTEGLQEQAAKVTALVAERDEALVQRDQSNKLAGKYGDAMIHFSDQVDAITAELAAYKASHPDPGTPSPAPGSGRLQFGVGVDVLGTLEAKAGKPVAYHRTYFTLPTSGVHAGAVAQAKADLAAGRTPVMSFKLPSGVSWAQAATGAADGPASATAAALAALDGIVVVAVHHEPEGDGTLADYLAMTKHLVPVIKRGKVQFWCGFTGYHQLYGSSEWKLDKLLVPGVDGYGFDPYLSYGASSTKWQDQRTAYYAKFGAWAKKSGVQWGIWETGMNEQAATSGLAQATAFVADCAAGAKAEGAAMWIWFASETTKDGKHNWKLTSTGADKLTQMAAVVAQYAR